MTDQRKTKPIEVDYRGKPITSGIPVRNNQEYVAKAGGLILVTHFLFHAAVIVYWSAVGIGFVVSVLPGIALILIACAIQHGVFAGMFAITGCVVFVLGVAFWVIKSVVYSKKLLQWFQRTTKMRFVGNYRGPFSGTGTNRPNVAPRSAYTSPSPSPARQFDAAEWEEIRRRAYPDA